MPVSLKPTVLVVTAKPWFSTARLAMALAKAGFRVEAICPKNHPLTKTSVVRHAHHYFPHAPLHSLVDAIAATNPNLIVPGDDIATGCLHQLYDRERRNGKAGETICALIERSLGAAESFSKVEQRAEVLRLARAAGVRAPETEVIPGTLDLRKSLARLGFPAVLKVDGTSGGMGVRIVRTFEEAKRAFRELQEVRRSSQSPFQALMYQGKSLLRQSQFRGVHRPVVNGQAFVNGGEAISEVVCWQGNVLGSLHFQVLTKQYPCGPASVVRLIENSEMDFAVETMARELGLSGLHGFDFLLEERTGDAYLIEMNPRATQVGHLTLGPGRDLPAALYAAVTGDPLQIGPKVTEKDTVALFPQEWMRDRRSVHFKTGYHDVPWDEPRLVRACVLGYSHSGVRPTPYEQEVCDLSLAPVSDRSNSWQRVER